jgi:hypothetical protein
MITKASHLTVGCPDLSWYVRLTTILESDIYFDAFVCKFVRHAGDAECWALVAGHLFGKFIED